MAVPEYDMNQRTLYVPEMTAINPSDSDVKSCVSSMAADVLVVVRFLPWRL